MAFIIGFVKLYRLKYYENRYLRDKLNRIRIEKVSK